MSTDRWMLVHISEENYFGLLIKKLFKDQRLNKDLVTWKLTNIYKKDFLVYQLRHHGQLGGSALRIELAVLTGTELTVWHLPMN